MKTAIIYLLKSDTKDIQNIKKSIYLLEKHYNWRFKNDIIVFHEDSLDQHSRQRIQGLSPRVSLYEISLYKNESIRSRWDPGYCGMCHFFAMGFLDELPIKHLDYIWRLDSDSFITKDIKYDVFKYMENNDVDYGYVTIMGDSYHTSINLWHETEKFAKKNDVKLNINGREWNRQVYYTNFEIIKLDVLRKPEYLNYVAYMNKTNGFHKYRWGDHCIRYVAIKGLGITNKTHKFSDIGYVHYPFQQAGNK